MVSEKEEVMSLGKYRHIQIRRGNIMRLQRNTIMNGNKRHNNEGTAAVDEKKWKDKVKGKEYEGTSGKEHCEGKTEKKCVQRNKLKEKVQEKVKWRKFKGKSGRNGSKERSGKQGSSKDKQLV